MNLYGIVKEFVIDREIDHIEETTITVYMEQLLLFLLFFARNTPTITKECDIYE